MAKNLYNVGDVCKVVESFNENKIGKFVTIKEVLKTQAQVIFPDGEEELMEYDCLQPSSSPTTTRTIPIELYEQLDRLGLIPNEVRNHNVGDSNYSEHLIQPWAIWIDWNLNPFDADIVKRVLRTKESDSRLKDYKKIIHVCEERIRQLSAE
jgi:hypothetical protein